LLSFGVCSDPGPSRVDNEDYAVAYTPGDPNEPWERGPLFVIADGMGGHAAGEVASRVAVETVAHHWTTTPFDQPGSALRTAARAANLAVIDASSEPGRSGMGTTLTALTLNGHEAFIAHVGDTRAYLIRGESCTQLTTDHSRVGEMLRMKLITVEQAAMHPARSQLTKSLGADPLVQVQLVHQPVQSGDVLVLCCDGLWDAVAGPEMATLVAAGSVGSAGSAARRLVETAVARKAADNVTAVVVRMNSDRPIPPTASRRSFFRRARS
jgi:protein phosphatase